MDNPEELAKKLAHSRVERLDLPKKSLEKQKSQKALIISLSVFGGVLLLLLVAFFVFFHGSGEELRLALSGGPKEPETSEPVSPVIVPAEEIVNDPEPETPKYYSVLSGEQIVSEDVNGHPTFCIQIPNGVDGARPQAGLHEAKVVFEAIAESGITRFSAVFQDPPAVVGPIRSLRLYYLNWDMPFNCTVVHAGGSDEALSALDSYGARSLSEDYDYMWRSSTNYTVQRLWNNLFTSGENLKNYNNSKGYLSSDIKSFAHMTPIESARNKIDVQAKNKLRIDEPAKGDTDAIAPTVTRIVLRIGAMLTFNPVYNYDQETNTYLRSYETGVKHTSYDCTGKTDSNPTLTPELVCEEVQIAPKVVVAMMVQERKASYDNYHEDISTMGAGDAYVFQNGIVIKGTWEKSSKDEQIIFRDENNELIKLVPGNVWISALPVSYGASVSYE